MTMCVSGRRTEALVGRLLLAAIVFVAASCGGTTSSPSSSGPSSTVISPAVQPVASAAAIKATPPLDIAVGLPADTLSIGREFTLRLTITPRQDARQIRGQLTSSGAVVTMSTPALVWNSIAANRDLTAQATFRISGMGSGEIRAQAELLNDAGVRLYDRTTIRYFLITKEEILVGMNGLQALELEHLEHLRSVGGLTQAEYEKARERVLGGGALETNPTATP